MNVSRLWLLVVVSEIALLDIACGRTGEERVFDCSRFDAETTIDQLVAQFGAAQVTSERIPLGEGETEEGTVLFAEDPEQRLEIVWKDPVEKRWPRSIRAHGVRTRWASAEGLTLGMKLRAVEDLNGKPFRLVGFGWDRGGTVMSWGGGSLERSGGGCRLRARLGLDPVPEGDPATREVLGEDTFSSDHPALRSLDPHVVELWLDYPQE